MKPRSSVFIKISTHQYKNNQFPYSLQTWTTLCVLFLQLYLYLIIGPLKNLSNFSYHWSWHWFLLTFILSMKSIFVLMIPKCSALAWNSLSTRKKYLVFTLLFFLCFYLLIKFVCYFKRVSLISHTGLKLAVFLAPAFQMLGL